MRPFILITFLVVLVTGCGAPESADRQGEAGPAFDCSEASGQVEELICDDADLAALDRRMAEVYDKALENWPDDIRNTQRAMQRGWIKGRDECWKSRDIRGCVEYQYRSRIVRLQIQSGQLTAPVPTHFKCEGADLRPFIVSFYQETDPPSAVLTWGDDQVITFRFAAASGTRYTGDGVEFREHQGGATIDWFGSPFQCVVSPSTPASVPAMERIPLGGTSWRLVRFQSMDDTTLGPLPGEVYSLSFENDGDLFIQASCNKAQGTWQSLDNVSLELAPGPATLVACPSQLEERFLRDLPDIRSYVIRRGSLYLSLKYDGGIYEFEPVNREP